MSSPTLGQSAFVCNHRRRRNTDRCIECCTRALIDEFNTSKKIIAAYPDVHTKEEIEEKNEFILDLKNKLLRVKDEWESLFNGEIIELKRLIRFLIFDAKSPDEKYKKLPSMLLITISIRKSLGLFKNVPDFLGINSLIKSGTSFYPQLCKANSLTDMGSGLIKVIRNYMPEEFESDESEIDIILPGLDEKIMAEILIMSKSMNSQ